MGAQEGGILHRSVGSRKVDNEALLTAVIADCCGVCLVDCAHACVPVTYVIKSTAAVGGEAVQKPGSPKEDGDVVQSGDSSVVTAPDS